MSIRTNVNTGSEPNEEKRFSEARARLVSTIVEQTGIQDSRLLGAFQRVPRHRFVPEASQSRAYEDTALSIGYQQTISQPSMIAVMLEALQLEPTDRVLEVGAGSGYAAALLAVLSKEVFAIEIVPELAQAAQQRLSQLKIENVHVFEGNGREGLAKFGPFDKILVSAGSEDVPTELVQELAEGGRIAIPVGGEGGQRLLVGAKIHGSLEWTTSIPCIFVPLVKESGARTGN